jgi:predicted GTPase
MDLLEISPNIQGHVKRLRQGAAALAAFHKTRGRPADDLGRILDEVERQAKTAHKRFTVAFVGMYNCGKSTILNSLLGLQGAARLSDQDSPDTAKSIRLGYRADAEAPECVLRFRDGSTETMAWAEARAFTSEVYLEDHPSARRKAEELVEVEYFLANPLLLSLDFLDLPGTGTSNWRTDTALTHQRLKEAELVFWVIATSTAEPARTDLEDLRILQDVKAHVVPLINVLSDEASGISGEVSAAEMESAVRLYLAQYFAAGATFYPYFAREIDLARQRGEEPRKEWGLEPLVTYLSSLLGEENVRRERVRRIAGAVGSHLKRLGDHLRNEAKALDEAQSEIDEVDDALQRHESERQEIGLMLRPRIKELSEDASRHVIAVCLNAADSFIEEELRLSNWKLLGEAVKRNPEQAEQRMQARFRDDFLHLGKKPSWLDRVYRSFLDDVRDVVHGVWARFLRDLQKSSGPEGFDDSIGGDFLDSALDRITGALLQSGFLLLLAGVFTVLLVIPGGFVIEAVSLLGIVLVQIIQDPLEKARKNAKLRARVTLEANRLEILNVFVEEGMSIHKKLDEEFAAEQRRQGRKLSEEREALRLVRRELEGLGAELESFARDMDLFEAGVPI